MAERLRHRSREQNVPSSIPRLGTLTMQNYPRQLAMQSCELCFCVRCGTSNQIRINKINKIITEFVLFVENEVTD